MRTVILHWSVVTLLIAALIAVVVLGVTDTLAEDNTVRAVLGILALIAVIVRKPPESPPGNDVALALVSVGVASELAGAIAEGVL